MEMSYTIKYTENKHGYAKISPKGELVIYIPVGLMHNEKFQSALIEKGIKLQKKLEGIIRHKAVENWSILLFWERVSVTDIGISNNKKAIEKYLKEALYEYAEDILQNYAKKLWYRITHIIIRKTKSKWWSCTSEQKISLNRDLVHLPTKYIKYVIIHEVCHLKHKNHSKSFWNEVERLYPEYKQVRKEMKKIVILS